MTWLSWSLGAAAAIVAIPLLVLLYFLKLKRREVEISTTLLWKKAIQDLQANAPFQRLRKNLLLLLQLLALIVAAMALAQPQLRSPLIPPDRAVILIDRSGSMLAMDGASVGESPRSRLDEAKRQAVAMIDRMNQPTGIVDEIRALFGEIARSEAMIVAFDHDPDVIQSFTSNTTALKRAIGSIQPTEAPGRIAPAIRIASPFISPSIDEKENLRPGASLLVWSDGSLMDLDSADIHPATDIQFFVVGTDRPPNVAITALDARRTIDRVNESIIFVGLQSTDTQPRTVDVELAIDGVIQAVQRTTLPARTPDLQTPTGGVAFTLERATGAVVQVSLSTDTMPDAIESDNSAAFILSPAKRLRIAYIGDEDYLISAAVEGLHLATFDKLSPTDFEALTTSGSSATAYDVYILDRWVPMGASSDMPPGRFLVLGAIPPVPGIVAQDSPNEQPIAALTSWQRSHPVFQSVRLDTVRIAKQISVQVHEPSLVIARSSLGPAIIETAHTQSRVITTTFHPLDSNWPFDVSFVVTLASALRYLAESGEDAPPVVLRSGNILRTTLPPSAMTAELRGPAGLRESHRVDDGSQVVFGPIRESGLYQLSWEGEPGPRDLIVGNRIIRTFAVSMLDPHESEARRNTTLDLPQGEIRATDASNVKESGLRMWRWLLVAMIIILLFEWYTYNRRVIL